VHKRSRFMFGMLDSRPEDQPSWQFLCYNYCVSGPVSETLRVLNKKMTEG
jgi:hypothetical protein